MATIDLQSAYRAVTILPENRKSILKKPLFFYLLTDSISRHMIRHGYTCFNYLDDFIIIGTSYEATKMAQLYLIRLLRKLGFYISWQKTTSPNTTCKY